MEMENAQELIQRLNHSGKKLSKSHRRIAECIVSHYDKVVFMTASRLGERRRFRIHGGALRRRAGLFRISTIAEGPAGTDSPSAHRRAAL